MVVAKPHKMNIEITTKCNGQCIMCPQNEMERRGKYMRVPDIMKTVKEAYELGVRRIHPHLFGEPTMHPDYEMVLRMIRREYPDIKMANYTNGSKLVHKRIRDAMIEYLDEITISIDGASDFTMKMVRPGIQPSDVRMGVRELYESRGGAVKPYIKIRMTEMECNKSEALKQYSESWSKYCDDIFITYLQDFHGFRGIKVEHRGNDPCDRIFSQVMVTVDRDVILCCDDYRGEVILGNLNDATMREIWYGRKMEQIRQAHLNGKAKNILMCKECSWRGKLKIQ